MKRCPECHRFGITYDASIKHERCIWRDCPFVNEDDINIDEIKHPIRFHKFIAAISKKKGT